MSQAKVIFVYEGREVIIQCIKDEKMKDICQKYVNKINKDINSLVYLYGGNQLNFNLNYNEQANIIDKERNIMKVLVYDNNEYICNKCGEKIKIKKEKIDNIILSINNMNDTINGIKLNIDNIIKISKDNLVNLQLKNVNILLNTLNDDIKNINDKLNNLININNEIKIKNENNYIIAEIEIKENDINKDIRIINSYEESLRINKYIKKNENCNNEEEIKKCIIKINEKIIPFNYIHKFESKGKYTIKYIFNNNIKSTAFMFYECELLTSINLSNFNTSNVTDMRGMFYECSSLTSINLSNFNTSNVTDMRGMFYGCSSLTNINLSNFNTSKVTNISYMFSGCSSLTSINLSNFNTSNVTDISYMFYGCSSLTSINLSNFNTSNVTDMRRMFNECSSLVSINLSDFNTSNVTGMNYMFRGCSNLKKENINIKNRKFLDNKDLF